MAFMKKGWLALSICIAAGVIAFAADPLRGAFLGAISGTTTDPRSLGLMRNASMVPVRATLRTDILMDTPPPGGGSNRLTKGDFRLTFEAPAAYYSAIGKPAAERGMQAVAFNFWSRTGDPVGPDLIEQSRLCKLHKREALPCPGDPVAKRHEAGEWEVEVEMFNGVATPAERFRLRVAQLIRARSITEACTVYDDPQLAMTVVTVPEADYPPPVDGYVRLPKFCSGIYIMYGDRGRYRGEDAPRYFPPRVFYKFNEAGEFRFRVSCDAFGSHQICWMSVDFGSWSGRVVVQPAKAAEWDAAYSAIMNFLSRHVVARTID
ncbi:hypothetical protein [Bosea sp. 685]|uniref:hypothetical protein n=1 Tax=Bosea sp. 685 TaxID=3080057 RepID=UPI002892B78C|nr:hypothetical protein [Bosea sp. 685]WNJ90295.1 hypothetical protein RMR04_28570 [Bosea sp. 685]